MFFARETVFYANNAFPHFGEHFGHPQAILTGADRSGAAPVVSVGVGEDSCIRGSTETEQQKRGGPVKQPYLKPPNWSFVVHVEISYLRRLYRCGDTSRLFVSRATYMGSITDVYQEYAVACTPLWVRRFVLASKWHLLRPYTRRLLI